jgi:hypothetical protein
MLFLGSARLCLIMFAAITLGVDPVAAKQAKHLVPLKVNVYNEAHLDQSTLLSVEHEIERLYDGVGIRFEWFNCGTIAGTSCKDEAVNPLQFDLCFQHFSQAPSIQGRHVFGLAHTFSGTGRGAIVFVKESWLIQPPELGVDGRLFLGAVAAHELFHVVCRSREHGTSYDIMSGAWTPLEVSLCQRLQLSFTSQQAKRLKLAALEREEQSVAPHNHDSELLIASDSSVP